MFFAARSSSCRRPNGPQGRSTPIPTAKTHHVNAVRLQGPYPEGFETGGIRPGCFWGAERKFWRWADGIYVTAAGYAAG